MPKIRKLTLKKTVVETVEPLEGEDVWVADTVLPGFLLRVTPAGSRS